MNSPETSTFAEKLKVAEDLADYYINKEVDSYTESVSEALDNSLDNYIYEVNHEYNQLNMRNLKNVVKTILKEFK